MCYHKRTKNCQRVKFSGNSLKKKEKVMVNKMRFKGLKKVVGDKKCFLLIVLIGVLSMRFGPMLIGLEWRKDTRKFIDLLSSIILMCWCINYIRTKEVKRRWGAAIFVVMAVCLIYQGLSPCVESLITKDGIPIYVRENNDPGSLANVRYYKYVNSIFRGLLQVE